MLTYSVTYDEGQRPSIATRRHRARQRHSVDDHQPRNAAIRSNIDEYLNIRSSTHEGHRTSCIIDIPTSGSQWLLQRRARRRGSPHRVLIAAARCKGQPLRRALCAYSCYPLKPKKLHVVMFLLMLLDPKSTPGCCRAGSRAAAAGPGPAAAGHDHGAPLGDRRVWNTPRLQRYVYGTHR